MFVDKIDKLIDNVIIDFFNTFFKQNNKYKKIITKIKNEVNFVKYQKEINFLINSYILKIEKLNISKITTSQEYVIIIKNILKKYIFNYLFLTLGYYYKGKDDTYINNIIEFSKNQSNFDVKIDNYFNSDSNSKIINIYLIIKKILHLFKLNKNQRSDLIENINYKNTINLLNILGNKFLSLKILNPKISIEEKCHNLITSIIILEIYKKEDKSEINNILSEVNTIEGNYTYIDIVLSCKKEYDYSSLENLFDKSELYNGVVDSFYDLLTNNKSNEFYNNNYKINKMIKSKLIIPIVDDILLYDNQKESYDKNISEKFKYRREDTKIKYIVNKLDNIIDFYSENTNTNIKVRKKIYSLFYHPLKDRKSVTINSLENTKIINKLNTVGKNLLDKNDFLNDLKKYDLFSYINFNNIKNDGFNFVLDKNYEVVRYINFENSDDFKRDKSKHILYRTTSKDKPINIVGFIVSNENDFKHLKINKFKNIRSKITKKKNKNGYENTLSLLKKKIIDNKKITPNYWIFDSKKDLTKIKKYDEINKLKGNNNIQLIISQLYDDVIGLIYDKIVNKIKKKKRYISDSFKILKRIEKKYNITINRESDFYFKLEKLIFYEQSIKSKPELDSKEGIVNGLFGKVNKLLKMKKKKEEKIKILKVNENLKIDNQKDRQEKTTSICQHNLTLRNLLNMRKNNINKFNTDLYDFTLKYVTETYNDSFICKSCGFVLNIKKFVDSGIFKKSTNEYIPFITDSSYLLKDLDKLPYYQKYKRSISNMDKIVERFASINNIVIYVGSLHSNKISRRNIVKNVIDLINNQNKNSTKKYNNNRSKKVKDKYGITLSNLFNFVLNDKIFVYSTTHFDTYKNIKLNNIVSYIIILMMLNINDTQIISMGGTKLCNYYWFNKYGHILFEGLKININNKFKTENIIKYKVLCYILYFFSFMVSKYNLWKINDNSKVNNRKKIFNTQKIIIQTVIDLINSMLENNNYTKKNFLYKSISEKFYMKLNTLFKNENIFKILSNDVRHQIKIVKNVKTYANNSKPNYILLDEIKKKNNISISYVFNELNNYKFIYKKDPIYNLNTLGNVYLNKDYNKLKEHYTEIYIKKFHDEFIKKKKMKKNHFNNDMNKFKKYLIEKNKDTYNKNKVINKSIKNKNIELTNNKNDLIKNLVESFKKRKINKDNYNHMNELLKEISNVIGSNVNINKKDQYINYNAYVIKYSHNGALLNKPIVITEKDNKIKKIYNHSYFKKDILYYIDYKNVKTEVFYDKKTLILLGYKTQKTGYVKNTDFNNRLFINYSIRNKLLYFGFPAINININNYEKELKHKNKKMLNYKKIKNIIRDRIDFIKKSIYIFKVTINKIKNNLIIKNELESESTKIDIVEKYNKKIGKMNLFNNNKQILSDYKILSDNLFFKNFKFENNKLYEIDIINTYNLIDYDFHGNLLFYYLVTELLKLIRINKNNFIKTNIIFMIIDIINSLYDKFSYDYVFSDHEMRKFSCILKSTEILKTKGFDNNDFETKTDGIYSEFVNEEDANNKEYMKEVEEQKYDDIQESTALDIDVDEDYDILNINKVI
jgi:hypothetical protein